jgi:hypothetical protein
MEAWRGTVELIIRRSEADHVHQGLAGGTDVVRTEVHRNVWGVFHIELLELNTSYALIMNEA